MLPEAAFRLGEAPIARLIRLLERAGRAADVRRPDAGRLASRRVARAA